MTREDATAPRLDIALPPSIDGSSFETYRCTSAAQFEITLPEVDRPQDFFVDGTTWQLGAATVARVHSSAQRIRRGPDQIAAAATASVQIGVLKAGEGEFACDSSREYLQAGDINVFDSRCAYTLDISAFDLRLVSMPRDRLPPVLLTPRIHGLRLLAGEAGTRLLAANVESLISEIGDLSVAEADHAASALFGLAAGLVEVQLGRRDLNRRRWENPQLDAGMAFIERRWSDPNLNSEAVMAHLGGARSGMYRLFAPLGGIDKAIRQRRLDHAMRTLLSGTEPGLSMEMLALGHGFRNEINFTRAFQARFGASPNLFRSRLASGDRAWLAEQAERVGFKSLQAWLTALAYGSPSDDAQTRVAGD